MEGLLVNQELAASSSAKTASNPFHAAHRRQIRQMFLNEALARPTSIAEIVN
jgi:hypothetical protein